MKITVEINIYNSGKYCGSCRFWSSGGYCLLFEEFIGKTKQNNNEKLDKCSQEQSK